MEVLSNNKIRVALIGLALVVVSLIAWTFFSSASKATLPQQAIHDVIYDDAHPKYCIGDIYIPSHTEGTALPAVIVVHGGGWDAGDKNDGSTGLVVSKLVESGFAVFDINYRLQNEDGKYPNNLDDVQQACKFFQTNGPTYGIDPKNISALGISAGAHLALLAAYTENNKNLNLKSVVAIAPATDLTKLFTPTITKYFPANDVVDREQASPLAHISSAVPTLLMHGTSDSTIPFSQSQLLSDNLSAHHKPVKLIAFKNADHNFFLIPGREQERANVEIIRFLKSPLSATNELPDSTTSIY
ncbi:MAG TPA: alpha/beta hydrolase [Drouetiella sp.]